MIFLVKLRFLVFVVNNRCIVVEVEIFRAKSLWGGRSWAHFVTKCFQEGISILFTPVSLVQQHSYCLPSYIWKKHGGGRQGVSDFLSPKIDVGVAVSPHWVVGLGLGEKNCDSDVKGWENVTKKYRGKKKNVAKVHRSV